MQFTTRNSDAIRAGDVTVSFRHWQRPHAKVGGVYRLRGGGAVEVVALGAVRLSAISAEEARQAGFDDVESLAAFLRLPLDAAVTRVDFRLTDEENRKRPPALSSDEVWAKLQKMDQRSATPWTMRALTLIADNPATRAADLAPALGWQTPVFKTNVRKLKALGLTRSLQTGYELTELGLSVVAVGGVERIQ